MSPGLRFGAGMTIRKRLRVEGLKSCPRPLKGMREKAVRSGVSRAPRGESEPERLSRAFSVVEFQGDLRCEDVRADDQTDDVRELRVNLRR